MSLGLNASIELAELCCRSCSDFNSGKLSKHCLHRSRHLLFATTIVRSCKSWKITSHRPLSSKRASKNSSSETC